jgi:hypothetical protein
MLIELRKFTTKALSEPLVRAHHGEERPEIRFHFILPSCAGHPAFAVNILLASFPLTGDLA